MQTYNDRKLTKGKAIKSTDPLKKIVVAAFKARFNCRKVTCVEQVGSFTFQAHLPPGYGGEVSGWQCVELNDDHTGPRNAAVRDAFGNLPGERGRPE